MTCQLYISEEGKIDLDLGIGDAHVHEIGGSGSVFEDYPGNSFEKVGEIDLEEEPQIPPEPVPSISFDVALTREEPRKKEGENTSWVYRSALGPKFVGPTV